MFIKKDCSSANSLFQIVAAVPADRQCSVLALLLFYDGDEIVKAVGLRFDVYRIELEHDARPVRPDHVYPIVQVVIVIRRVVQRRYRALHAGHCRIQIVIIRELCVHVMQQKRLTITNSILYRYDHRHKHIISLKAYGYNCTLDRASCVRQLAVLDKKSLLRMRIVDREERVCVTAVARQF